MSKVHIYNHEGKVTGDLELNPEHFDVKVRPSLVHQVVIAQQANARTHTGHTKTRGEVRGGGKKPWKQKGTGRARQGSIRSVQWVGGGIAHGPRNERNFSLKVNRKVKRAALFMALSDKVQAEKLMIVEPFILTEAKTKIAARVLEALKLKRRTLIVTSKSNPSLLRMLRNIQHVRLVTVNTLNVVDVVSFPTLVFEKEAIPAFEAVYTKA